MPCTVVKDYYGKTLQKSADLKMQACCTLDDMLGYVAQLLSKVHDEVRARYYGCGLVVPLVLKGKRVLDLGRGSGRDAMCSRAHRCKGEVIGIDMTAEQLLVAR